MGLLTPIAVRIGAIEWLPEYLPYIVKIDDGLQKVTGGRIDLLTVAGLPSVTMVIRGRKSGLDRTTTVLAAPVGDGEWLVAGSYFGSPKSPAWVYNLRSAPVLQVEEHGELTPMTHRELEGDERAEAWQSLLKVWPNFTIYERRTTRTIPIFRLTPAR